MATPGTWPGRSTDCTPRAAPRNRSVRLDVAQDVLAELIASPAAGWCSWPISTGRVRRVRPRGRATAIDSKSPAIAMPRMLAMFLARKYTRAALSEIGSVLRPPQPQHGHLGPAQSGRVADRRQASSARPRPMLAGRRRPPHRIAVTDWVVIQARRASFEVALFSSYLNLNWRCGILEVWRRRGGV